ncbi:hypothetical protein HWI79_1929 [Cryptosporidium felis]|nr:hypothetical protein HWI79_1929 [Cryptosporidium felis]
MFKVESNKILVTEVAPTDGNYECSDDGDSEKRWYSIYFLIHQKQGVFIEKRIWRRKLVNCRDKAKVNTLNNSMGRFHSNNKEFYLDLDITLLLEVKSLLITKWIS